MKTKFLPILFLLAFSIINPGWAQLQRLPVKNVQIKPGLEIYNNFLANRLLKVQNPGPGNGEKPFRRLEWFFAPRLQTDGSYPAGARWNAFIEARANVLAKTNTAAAANWTSIGPNNFAGRMLDIAFDPNNANVIWAGAASGGIWRSANGGSTWMPMDDQLPTLAIGCVVTHPTNSNIIYIGTGEGGFNIDAVEGVGVLKSIDGGATWTQTGLSFLLSQGEAVNEMVIDPDNPNVLIAATRDGIYRTADAGATWARTLGTTSGWDGKEVVMDPSNSNTVYAALGYPWGNANNGIYKSTDNGVTWTILTSGLPASTTMGRISLTLSASSPNTLYAGIAHTINNGSSLLGIYRTTDGGSNWTLQSNTPNHYNGQGWYNNVIAVDPTNASIVYSGGTNIYKSTNAGVTWSTITNGIHVDFHAIAFNGGTVYVGCDGGLYKSTTGGSSWTSINSGLTTFQFYKMGSDFNNTNRAMGGTQDNGTKEYNGTTTWTTRLGGDGGEVVFDYSNSNVIYGEYQNGNHQKSTNGGASWLAINTGVPSGPWVTPVEMDPVTPSVLYTIGNNNLYKTSNGGTNWTLLFDATETLDKDIQVAPSNNQTLYVAGANAIYQSTNGGTNFTKISTALAATSLTAMAVHPSQPQALYVANGGWNTTSHVYKTTNGGTTWQNVTSNLPNVPCNTIVLDPAHPEIVYVGTDLGVYVSTDEGATWSAWNTGLPNVVVNELDIQATARVIRAATHGRGMFQSPMLEPNPGLPAISINEVTVTEGNTGTVNATFAVTLSTASAQTVTVNFATANGTAIAGSDYVGDSGMVIFAAGSMSQNLFVTVNGDVLDEPNETFWVNLSNPVNATIADNQGQGTIADNDAMPALSINNAVVTEGNAGTVNAIFTVTLAAASGQTVTVNYATANSTATAGSDYVSNSGMLTFAAGNTAQTLNVTVNGDATVEANETFLVNLSSAVNATIVDNQAVGTINNDDVAPVNLALSKPATALSSNGSNVPGRAVDGSTSTYWRSGSVNSTTVMWWRVDLGASYSINRVVMKWRSSYYARNYQVQVSSNGTTFTAVYTDNAGNGGVDDVTFAATTARFVRVYMTRNNSSSERLDEVEVYANAGATLSSEVNEVTHSAPMPEEVTLAQNYPNPFNPATTLSYSLPQGANAVLSVVNLHGQIVATLANGYHQAGVYQVTFDAASLPSGVYFAMLKAGSVSQVRRMLLAK